MWSQVVTPQVPFHSITLDVEVLWKDKTDVHYSCMAATRGVYRKYLQCFMTYKNLRFCFLKLFFLLCIMKLLLLKSEMGWEVTKELVMLFLCRFSGYFNRLDKTRMQNQDTYLNLTN